MQFESYSEEQIGKSGVWESSVGQEIAEGQQIWGLDET